MPSLPDHGERRPLFRRRHEEERYLRASAIRASEAGLQHVQGEGPASGATTAPGPDVEPIHPRQIVVLPTGGWAAWLNLSRPEAEILRALPAGSLEVRAVRGGSDPS